MRRTGYFITFEGIDGCGKTTQLKLAKNYLKRHGYSPEILREPGSTPLSEKIRKVLLNKKISINPISELMLYLAARAELVENTIAPYIKKNKIILCDRFYDSTTAYQGYGRGIDVGLIEKLNQLAVGRCKPNLTFVIDIDYATSLGRRKKKADRLESEPKSFFNRVRKGFLKIAHREKKRIVVINGRPPADKVFSEVKDCLRKKLKIDE